MMTELEEHELRIASVKRRDRARDAGGNSVYHEWEVTATGRDGVSFEFVLPGILVPIPGGVVVVRWFAEVATP